MTGTSYLVSIACLLIAAKVAGWLCQRIGVPPVLGQLVVGVLGGSSLLGWVHPDSLLSSLSGLGVILLMFIAGVETDMKQMRQVGVAALVSASMGVILPFVVGSVFAYFLGHFGFPLLSRWLPRLLALETRIGLILALVLLYAWSAALFFNVAATT